MVWYSIVCCTILRGCLHELGFAANLGQDASAGQPISSQTPVTVYMNPSPDPAGSCKQLQAFDWRRIDSGSVLTQVGVLRHFV